MTQPTATTNQSATAATGCPERVFLETKKVETDVHQGITYSDSHYTESEESELAMLKALSSRGDNIRFEIGL
jgi:hypothetical protein